MLLIENIYFSATSSPFFEMLSISTDHRFKGIHVNEIQIRVIPTNV